MDNGKAVATRDSAALMEQVLVVGDLDKLTPAQRLDYVLKVCEATGLSPATRPFEYIRLSGRLVLYARKDATDQLRRIHGVSLVDVKEHDDPDRGIHVAWALVRMPDGREDRDVGIVSTKGLTGDALVNALMKCVTKAKRRATLSICGLGMLDETEIETIPAAQVQVAPVAQAPQVLSPTRPRSPAPPASEGTAATLYCADCHKEIRAVSVRGQAPLAPEVIAQKSLDKFGRQLCFGCATKADDVRLDALHDPVTGEVSGSEAVAEEQPEF